MLELKETDLPGLFIILVVLPLVAYVLLGKWSESSRKNDRVSLLAELVEEEAFRTESMAAAAVIPAIPIIPLVPIVPKNAMHVCARCSVPATTRCSRCKSVRYCSGKCQILHWRQVHKHECQQLETNNLNSSPMISLNGESNDEMNYQFSGYNKTQSEQDATSNDDWSHQSNGNDVSASIGSTASEGAMERRSSDRKVSRKSKSRREDGDANTRHKMKSKDSEPLCNGPSRRSTKHEYQDFQTQHENISCPVGEDFFRENSTKDEVAEMSCSSDMSTKRVVKSKIHKSQNSVANTSSEQAHSGLEVNEQTVDEPISTQGRNGGGSSMGIMRMIGLKKSTKPGRSEASQVVGERENKLKMLFPYEEFVKFFQYDVFNLSPRGLINCGNSCYCNAVLQCLTFTKPLTIYLLGRLHSKTCCVKNWCLMCELEQHVIMLREGGGPLSPGRILTHMRSINRQIGDGSQEDAHEFLRLLLTSMQSICLAGWGGENAVDPRLQETTFIQHTFGGRLKSKVKCLRCHHESERYENMMDLTLEIYGWVESLEDALTQFTTIEDLDGENMYRCGRCMAYVRARKQLSIHEAPNILTIVLKRFQEGSYGKINKCITFPEMLDMVPFMSGTDDIPPLYMLYGVVVHLDTTLNASFSGHYVSYVKDLLGNWLRIDDTEVQPVSISQVMSEGAYILFYTRSFPRPSRAHSSKSTLHQTPGFVKHFTSKTQKPSRLAQNKSSCHLVGPNPSSELFHTNCMTEKRYAESFSDATSSDWSIFTSSDEASFTTESRDSFSTIDGSNTDPFSSIFDTIYGPGSGLGLDYSRTVSCRSFTNNKPLTRFFSEGHQRMKRDESKYGVADSSRTPYFCTL